MTATPLLEARGLGRQVEGRWLWRGLDLRLEPGEIGVLVGPSGSGKSLLFRALCGLDRPDEGRVLIGGTALDELEPPEARSRVLFLSQDPLIVPGSVLDNLRLPLGFGVHREREFPGRDELESWMGRLGKTPAFLDRSHEVLSGGEAQVVALLRVLLLDPEVLLLDEPTANLDPESASAAETLVRQWVERDGRAVLWTSHDPLQADRVQRGARLELGGAA